MNRKLAIFITIPYFISVLLYLTVGFIIYFDKIVYYDIEIYFPSFIWSIVFWPYPVFLGSIAFFSLVASIGFVIKLKLNKSIILGLVGCSLMGFFLIGYFIAFSTVDLVYYLYVHFILWLIVCLINGFLIISRLKPSKNDKKLVKSAILEACFQFSLLQLKEISELCKVDEKTVSRVIKTMEKTEVIYFEYDSKLKLIFFDYDANHSNMERIINNFKLNY